MQDSEDTQTSDPGRLNRLKLAASTILSRASQTLPLPESVIRFFRKMAMDDTPSPEGISPYEQAKDNLNAAYKGPDTTSTGGTSPVARLQTLRGAITAYWTSENWRSAWTKTGGLMALGAFGAQNTVWVAESFAALMESVTHLGDPTLSNAFGDSVNAGLQLAKFGALEIATGVGMQRLHGSLQRSSTKWIVDQFQKAAFAAPDILARFTHNASGNTQDPDAMPDSPHQRMTSSAAGMMRSAVNIGVNSWTAVTTSAFVGLALADKSVPIPVLEQLGETLNHALPMLNIDFRPGDYGTLALAGLTISGYIGVCAPLGKKISNMLESNIKRMGAAHGRFSQTLVNMFANGEQIAAARSHMDKSQNFDADHAEFDAAWDEQNRHWVKFAAYNHSQSFIGHNVVSFIPALAAFAGKKASDVIANPVQHVLETQRLVSSLLSSMSAVIDILPAYSEMRAEAGRVSEMAQMFEKVQDREAFYRLSGVHEFTRGQIISPYMGQNEPQPALTIDNLELMHRGADAPFLSIPHLSVESGEWLHIKGPSGAGKSSLIKSVADIWPYGRGDIATSEEARIFFAYQEPDISGTYTLAEHLMYGMSDVDKSAISTDQKDRMRWALKSANLEEFIEDLDQAGRGGKSWTDLLSGGQKQRLVLARILYQSPDLILLDEPTSALDPDMKSAFFAALKEGCPEATVLAITHDESTPSNGCGQSYFSRALYLSDGSAEMVPIESAEETSNKEAETTSGTTAPVGLISASGMNPI